jgi:hypothetical protein
MRYARRTSRGMSVEQAGYEQMVVRLEVPTNEKFDVPLKMMRPHKDVDGGRFHLVMATLSRFAKKYKLSN